jgi:hypothetical protein
MYADQARKLFVVLAVGHSKQPLAQIPGSECQAFLRALNERHAQDKMRYWARELRKGEATPKLQFDSFQDYLDWKEPKPTLQQTLQCELHNQAALVQELGVIAHLAEQHSAALRLVPAEGGYVGAAAESMARLNAKSARKRTAKKAIKA